MRIPFAAEVKLDSRLFAVCPTPHDIIFPESIDLIGPGVTSSLERAGSESQCASVECRRIKPQIRPVESGPA